MSNKDRKTRSSPDIETYEIILQGRIEQHWENWFEGFEIRLINGYTCLRADIIDQSELHGHLRRIRDLGIPIVSMRRLDPI